MLKRPVSGRSVETSSEMIKWWSPWNFIYKSSLERTILDQLWNSNHLTWFWYSYNVNRLQCVNFSQILSVKTTMSFTTKLLKIHIYLIWRIKNAILIWFHSRVRALMAARPNATQRHSLYRRRLERTLKSIYPSYSNIQQYFPCTYIVCLSNLRYDGQSAPPWHYLRPPIGWTPATRPAANSRPATLHSYPAISLPWSLVRIHVDPNFFHCYLCWDERLIVQRRRTPRAPHWFGA